MGRLLFGRGRFRSDHRAFHEVTGSWDEQDLQLGCLRKLVNAYSIWAIIYLITKFWTDLIVLRTSVGTDHVFFLLDMDEVGCDCSLGSSAIHFVDLGVSSGTFLLRDEIRGACFFGSSTAQYQKRLLHRFRNCRPERERFWKWDGTIIFPKGIPNRFFHNLLPESVDGLPIGLSYACPMPIRKHDNLGSSRWLGEPNLTPAAPAVLPFPIHFLFISLFNVYKLSCQ